MGYTYGHAVHGVRTGHARVGGLSRSVIVAHTAVVHVMVGVGVVHSAHVVHARHVGRARRVHLRHVRHVIVVGHLKIIVIYKVFRRRKSAISGGKRFCAIT